MPLPFKTAAEATHFLKSQGYRLMTVNCIEDGDPVFDYYQVVHSEDDVTPMCKEHGVVPIESQFAQSILRSYLNHDLVHIFPDLGMMYRSVMDSETASDDDSHRETDQPVFLNQTI